MNQSVSTEKSKKYKNIEIPVKTNTLNTNNEFLIASSLKRISTKANEITKIFDENSKATTSEIHEQIALATDEIINIFYDMELAILSEGAIPLVMGEKFYALKAVISLCKIHICQPGLNEIPFPQSFIEEYSRLLERTDKAIIAIKTRMAKLKAIEGTVLLEKVLEKNLFTLTMLHMHYINALGLPETNL